MSIPKLFAFLVVALVVLGLSGAFAEVVRPILPYVIGAVLLIGFYVAWRRLRSM